MNDFNGPPRGGFETALVHLLSAVRQYIEGYHERFGECVAHDYVLGPHVLAVARSATALLDGPTGRIDPRTYLDEMDEVLHEGGFLLGTLESEQDYGPEVLREVR